MKSGRRKIQMSAIFGKNRIYLIRNRCNLLVYKRRHSPHRILKRRCVKISGSFFISRRPIQPFKSVGCIQSLVEPMVRSRIKDVRQRSPATVSQRIIKEEFIDGKPASCKHFGRVCESRHAFSVLSHKDPVLDNSCHIGIRLLLSRFQSLPVCCSRFLETVSASQIVSFIQKPLCLLCKRIHTSEKEICRKNRIY